MNDAILLMGRGLGHINIVSGGGVCANLPPGVPVSPTLKQQPLPRPYLLRAACFPAPQDVCCMSAWRVTSRAAPHLSYPLSVFAGSLGPFQEQKLDCDFVLLLLLMFPVQTK